MGRALTGLPYYGGKARLAKWITGLLPWDYNSTFVVPFGGQANILLRRDPVENEIYNDLDLRLSNWWESVRKDPDLLGHMVDNTPHSEYEYENAVRIIDDKSYPRVDRAHAFYVLCVQSFAQNLSSLSWKSAYAPNSRNKISKWSSDKVMALSDRFRYVQVFNRPAEKILEKTLSRDYCVIYADPPYISAETDPYNVCELDIPKLSELFSNQKGMVAISGYGDEWNHLGWHRSEKEAKVNSRPNTKAINRLEVLWTNYDPIEVME